MKILQKNSSWAKPKAALVAGLASFAILLLPQYGIAQTVPLSNGGSTAMIDLSGGTGIDSWKVDTSPVNQLDSEWFYYSINGGAAQPINTIATQPGGSMSSTVTGGNTLNVTYSDPQISVSVQFELNGSGSGSGSADLTANNVTVNSSGTLAGLNIYEYANFNLLQSFDNGITISQGFTGPPPFGVPDGYNGVTQTSGATAITEAINDPNAVYAETGLYNNVMGDVLSGHNLNDTLSFGPTSGDNVAWAFEWAYQNVAAGAQQNVLEDQTLSIANVPEPSSIALIGLGFGAVGLLRRHRSS